jgi:formamidopyrimidine-DNA glycosylase
VLGRRVVEAWAHPSPKFTPALEAAGARFTGVARRGKYLLLSLDDGRELVVHLGMTGRLRLRDPDDDRTFTRAWWELDDGTTLEYRDVRRFGRLHVVPAGEYATIPTLWRQGPDAVDAELDADDLWRALRRSRRVVKTQLLSQRPLAGVGNIYADEALWSAGIHPGSRQLSRARSAALLVALREVLDAGIRNGGTTLRDYRSVDGSAGRNQLHLHCYGRAGEPCERCGAVLRRVVLDARSTTFCPRCQHR